MNWGSASAFFDMGGYGLYVWGSYGLALLIAVLEPWMARRRRVRAMKQAAVESVQP
jgi:heme exporter protein D